MLNEQHPPVAGWYADPASADLQRYWNGEQWTEHHRPPPPDLARRPLLIAGYAAAVLSPIIGLLVGIVLMVRQQAGHGLAIVAISVVAGVAGLLLGLTPMLISTWLTGVIAVFVGIPLAILRGRVFPEVVWDGDRWIKRKRQTRLGC